MAKITCEGCPVGDAHCGGLRHGNCDSIKATSPAPGLGSKVASFATAMRGLVADRGRLAPRAVRKARRASCQACPFHVASPDSCSKCGCGSVVPGGLAAKLAIASSTCPDEPPRWGPV